MLDKLTMSICTYKDGLFEVILKHTETGREIVFTGNQKLSEEDFDLVQEIAPACVWTKYLKDEF